MAESSGGGRERARLENRGARQRSRLALTLRPGKSDAHHVRCAGRTKGGTGNDDDAVALLRKTLAVGKLAGALYHVVDSVRVACDDGLPAPDQRQPARSGCV